MLVRILERSMTGRWIREPKNVEPKSSSSKGAKLGYQIEAGFQVILFLARANPGTQGPPPQPDFACVSSDPAIKAQWGGQGESEMLRPDTKAGPLCGCWRNHC